MDAVQDRIEQDQAFRDKLIAWLEANGVNDGGRVVPYGERPTFADGRLTIRLYTLSAAGRVQFDPGADDKALTHSVTVPVVVQPDADVQTWLR